MSGRPRLLFAVALLLCAAAAPSHAADSLRNLEKSFKHAIDRASEAAVVCLPGNAKPGMYGSSGVIVSRKGLVLSDGDVGGYAVRNGKKVEMRHTDVVTVRVPDLKKGGFKPYQARVLLRDRELDTSLLRINEPPPAGFSKFLRPATSDPLRVGAFTFTAGNAFSLSKEGAPTLTAGVVASLTYLPPGDPGGKYASIYTSAAVNPGVNGGPLVDVHGRLVGTVSTFVTSGPDETYQFLGKVVPIDRLRHAYSPLKEFKELFQGRTRVAPSAGSAETMEMVFHHTAREAYGSVVSLTVQRAPVAPPTPATGTDPQDGEKEKPGAPDGKKAPPKRPRAPPFPSYRGPVSGFVASTDGLIVTSLYNLTNILLLAHPNALRGRPVPPELNIRGGIERITGVTVHYSGGGAAEARVLAYHEGLGIAVLRAKMSAGTTAIVRTMTPAPADTYRPGRFVLALGNPFGKERLPDPLLTVGILSKFHSPESKKVWRGQWQTDAGATDANSGGPAVDLNGRLLGMMTPWDIQHGRNSGIGFVVPWEAIAAVLPQMAEGRTYARPYMGVQWDLPAPEEGQEPADYGTYRPRIKRVIDGSAAAAAGLQPGDVIIEFGGERVDTIAACSGVLDHLWSGDTVKIKVRRDGHALDLECTLGIRP